MISNLPVKSTNNDFAEIWRCYLTDLRFCTGGLPAVVQSCTWSSSYHQTVPSLTQAAGAQWPCRHTDWSSSVQLSEPCLSHTLTHQPMPENQKPCFANIVSNAFAICTPTNAFLFHQKETKSIFNCYYIVQILFFYLQNRWNNWSNILQEILFKDDR